MAFRGRGWIHGAREAHFQIDCQPRYISIRCFADGRVTNACVANSDINVTSKLRTIMPLAIHRSVFCRISSNSSNLSMVVAQSWSSFHLRNKKKKALHGNIYHRNDVRWKKDWNNLRINFELGRVINFWIKNDKGNIEMELYL